MFNRVFCSLFALVSLNHRSIHCLPGKGECAGLEVMTLLSGEGYEALFERSSQPMRQQILIQPNEQAALRESGLPVSRPNTDYLLHPGMAHLLFGLQGPSSGITADYARAHPLSEVPLYGLTGWGRVR